MGLTYFELNVTDPHPLTSHGAPAQLAILTVLLGGDERRAKYIVQHTKMQIQGGSNKKNH